MQEPQQQDYIRRILEEEFPDLYWRYHASGLLDTEVDNMLLHCDPVFEELGFDEDNRLIAYAITGTIAAYLASQRL